MDKFKGKVRSGQVSSSQVRSGSESLRVGWENLLVQASSDGDVVLGGQVRLCLGGAVVHALGSMFLYVCMYVCIYVCMYVCMNFVCMYVCM